MTTKPRTPKRSTGRVIVDEMPDPPPPRLAPARRIDLSNLDGVAVELAKLYRSMRRGEIDMGDGTKLAFVLGQLRQTVQARDDFERELLERTASGGDWQAAAEAVRKKLGLSTEPSGPTTIQIVGRAPSPR